MDVASYLPRPPPLLFFLPLYGTTAVLLTACCRAARHYTAVLRVLLLYLLLVLLCVIGLLGSRVDRHTQQLAAFFRLWERLRPCRAHGPRGNNSRVTPRVCLTGVETQPGSAPTPRTPSTIQYQVRYTTTLTTVYIYLKKLKTTAV